MKRNIIGKQINEFAKTTNDIPSYFGDRFYTFEQWLSSDTKRTKVNGEFMANKYNSVLAIIEETNDFNE